MKSTHPLIYCIILKYFSIYLQTHVGGGNFDIQVEQQLNSLNMELNKLEEQLRGNINKVIDEISVHTMTVLEGEMMFCNPTVCTVYNRQ